MCPLLIQVQALQPIETPILRKMSSTNSFNQTTFSQSEQESKKLLAQLPKVNSWGVCNLELSHLKSQQLSKQLMRVSFPDLLTLTLTNDFIESVEFLSRLKAPNLHSIQLSNNCIMDVSSLKKIQTSQLKSLSLVKNNINEIEMISEIDSKALHVIKIETSCFRHQIEDIRALTKLIEPKVDDSFQIYLKGRKRIQERKIFQKVIQKNHNTICPKISISWME